jgi:hypothetical protein
MVGDGGAFSENAKIITSSHRKLDRTVKQKKNCCSSAVSKVTSSINKIS